MLKAILVLTMAILVPLGMAYGHGTGSEILPPVEMDGRMVTIQVSSEEIDTGVRVDLAMIQDGTGEPVEDVSYRIEARHGQTPLFSEEFQRGDGRMLFEFVSKETPGIETREVSEGGLFGIFGDSRLEVSGPGLADGGLYSLDVTILSAAGHSPPQPPTFNSAISVPITYESTIQDRFWGSQEMVFITYYDRLEGMSYDTDTGEISFGMPFEWDPGIIDQIETVHVEFGIPDTFGGLLVADFEAKVNGIALSRNTITVDDYFDGYRVVHIVILRGELRTMYDILGDDAGMMEFVARPVPGSPYSSVTSNGQYRILASVDPPGLPAGQEAVVSFNITNIFLRSLIEEVPYRMSVIHDGATLHTQSGVSSDEGSVTARLSVPDGVSGPGELRFYEIDGNDLAAAAVPIMFDGAVVQSKVPEWVRTTAGWWVDGMIGEESFIEAVKYLIENNIIQVQAVQADAGGGGPVEEWVRTTVGWWSGGLVSDEEFLASITYLMERGIIQVNLEG